MKRKLLLGVWLLVPVALLAYHYGPGQLGLARDRAARAVDQAKQLERAEDWFGAVEAYDAALEALPEGESKTRFQVRLARANARMFTGELPEAMGDLSSLLEDMKAAAVRPERLQEVRGALAGAQYYAAWLMRLETAPKEEWMAQAENARQNFRLLAEQSADTKAGSSEDYQKNLEAVIRLERMDLEELQGLPLPKECQGCKNCSQKCRSQKKSRTPKETKKKEDARGAGVGKRPEGSGS